MNNFLDRSGLKENERLHEVTSNLLYRISYVVAALLHSHSHTRTVWCEFHYRITVILIEQSNQYDEPIFVTKKNILRHRALDWRVYLEQHAVTFKLIRNVKKTLPRLSLHVQMIMIIMIENMNNNYLLIISAQNSKEKIVSPKPMGFSTFAVVQKLWIQLRIWRIIYEQMT